ncbi:MAG TPA: purple acid phosphatase [Nitrososphaeraceae archaeon]|nr:purple acid phosphatase [Nitrososphaeraceae archaeon]
MTILRSGILTVTIIILSIIITMTIPSISIEKSGIAIKNHSAYSQYSYPATAAGVTLADFNFAAAGDWGCTSDTTDTLKNIIDQGPEFVLALGDLSYDNSAKCWLEIITPIANKTMIAIGNHETDSTKKLKEYMDFFGLKGQYYSFNYQNVHFSVISTELPYEEGSAQYNFVNNDLSKVSLNPDIDWIVVYYHSLAYTSPANIGKGNSAEKELRDTYHPLFVKYGVDLVLQAHNHNYQRSFPIIYNSDNSTNPIITDTNNNNYHDPKGMVFGTIGTGGASIYPLTGQAPYVATQYVGFGFLNVDVINDGTTLSGKFIANDGTIKDQFTITK